MPLTSPALKRPPRRERGVFLLLGVSGSGKGSVAEALLETGALSAHASMGQWLREAVLDPGELEFSQVQPQGFSSSLEYLRHCVTQGLLIPDAWTENLIERQLQRAPSGRWVLDGYPRTIAAAQHLFAALERHYIPLLAAFELQVPKAVMWQRLLARGRADDTQAAITHRLEFYQSSVLLTLEWLEMRGVPVHRIDAARALEEVVEDIKNRLGSS